MDSQLHTVESSRLKKLGKEAQQQIIANIESGRVIYLPQSPFPFKETEQILLSEAILDGKHKNVSYDYQKQRLGGLAMSRNASVLQPTMKHMMHRFAEYAKLLVVDLLPSYENALQWGRTSYRPAQAKGRQSSKRKDDTRLHVDAFPSSPVNGWRILRVFCNVNPYGEPRVWHLGEPFAAVAQRFLPQIPAYSSLRAQLLKLFKATKTLRSEYDHDMLFMHDTMKLDDDYQQVTHKERVEFPPQSTWLVFTDQVSHAALSGQFLLEQTFYLPVEAMQQPEKSPLKQLEALKNVIKQPAQAAA